MIRVRDGDKATVKIKEKAKKRERNKRGNKTECSLKQWKQRRMFRLKSASQSVLSPENTSKPGALKNNLNSRKGGLTGQMTNTQEAPVIEM